MKKFLSRAILSLLIVFSINNQHLCQTVGYSCIRWDILNHYSSDVESRISTSKFTGEYHEIKEPYTTELKICVDMYSDTKYMIYIEDDKNLIYFNDIMYLNEVGCNVENSNQDLLYFYNYSSNTILIFSSNQIYLSTHFNKELQLNEISHTINLTNSLKIFK